MKELIDFPDFFFLWLALYSWKQILLKTKVTTKSIDTHTNGNSANESEVTGFHGEVSSVSKDGRLELHWALNFHSLTSELRPWISNTLGHFSQGQFSFH